MNDPRYVVTEIEGYLREKPPASSQLPGLSCHVLDTAYSHRVVFTARSENLNANTRTNPTDVAVLTPWERRERVRGLARARAMELNAA